jgi:anti-anti-sigma factor
MQTQDAFFTSMDEWGNAAATAKSSSKTVGVIDVGARLDARTAERMKSRFKKLAAVGQHRHIIDLSRVDDLDSGGLAGLISTLRAVRETGGSIDLVASTSHVKQILELTALTRIFKVHRTVKAALASL